MLIFQKVRSSNVRSSNCRMFFIYLLFYWNSPSFFSNVRRLFEMIFRRIVSWWFRAAKIPFWNLKSSVFSNELHICEIQWFHEFFPGFRRLSRLTWVLVCPSLVERWPKNLKLDVNCKQMSAVLWLLLPKSGVLKLRWFPPSLRSSWNYFLLAFLIGKMDWLIIILWNSTDLVLQRKGCIKVW